MAEFFSRALAARDEEHLYTVITNWLPRVVSAERASIALLTETRSDESDQYLEIRGLVGASGPMYNGRRLKASISATGRAAQQQETQLWRTAENPDRFVEGDELAEVGIDGVINAPLIVENQSVGTLNVARLGRGFTQDEAAAVTTIASAISMQLANFRSLVKVEQELVESRRQLVRLGQLGDLGQRLSSATNESEAFTQLADTLQAVLPVSRVGLTVPDHGRKMLRVLVIRSKGGGEAFASEFPMAGTAFAQAIETAKPVYVADLRQLNPRDPLGLVDQGQRSALYVPVLANNRVNLIVCSASDEVDAFRGEDQLLIEAAASVFGETVERMRAMEQVAARDRQLATIVDESPLLTLKIGVSGEILAVSKFGAERIGHNPAEIIGGPIEMLYPPDQHRLLSQQLAEINECEPGSVMTFTAIMVTANGKRRRIHHTGRLLLGEEKPAMLLVCEDVTELFELTERLEYEATHDSLTGLINRREFDRRLAEVAQGQGHAAVLYLDVDQFKIVNDTAGHSAGDALLVEIAHLLTGHLHQHDVVSRLGGDEFAVLLPNCTLANAVRVAERLRLAAREMVFTLNGRIFGTSISIGLVSISDGRANPDEIMGQADAACYLAKRDGRNRVSVSTAQRGIPESRLDGEWGSRVREAIAFDQLDLVAQTIVPIGGPDGKCRAEMLIRLVEADGNLAPASLFIPAAERLGLVSELDEWMVTKVTGLLAANPQTIDNIEFVSVNLSARSIETEDFLEFLLDELAKPGVEPSKLLFEITETAAFSQFAKAIRFMETVAAVGCRFALDDFGAGFSTFHYLKRLPIDVLKIDGSLVKDLATDPIDEAIVTSVTSVANCLGMETIAEFVDNSETIARLRAIGVTYAQGYFTGRPASVSEVIPCFANPAEQPSSGLSSRTKRPGTQTPDRDL